MFHKKLGVGEGAGRDGVSPILSYFTLYKDNDNSRSRIFCCCGTVSTGGDDIGLLRIRVDKEKK